MISLKKLRYQYNYSQSELADLLHTTQSTVSKWERGKSQPDHKTLLELCKLFDVSIDFLMDNENVSRKDEEKIIFREYIKRKYGNINEERISMLEIIIDLIVRLML